MFAIPQHPTPAVRLILAAALCCLCGIAPANAQTTDPQDAATSEWSAPVNLGPAVNSPHDEVFPMISHDGLSLYFASDRPGGFVDSTVIDEDGWGYAYDLYVARRTTPDAPWEAPQPLGPTINTPYAEHSVAFSADGHWMFFASNRPGGCGKHDIYASYREDPGDDFGWGKPVNLGCTVNSAEDDSCPMYHTDPETGAAMLYFVSTREGGAGSWDVYRSARSAGEPGSAAFGAPVWMDGLNSPSYDGHYEPKAGLLWSGRDGGHGDGDLWEVSRDPATGNWSFVNPGPPLNTEYDEEMPAVSHDGTRLYFPSNRPAGYGGHDLYVSTRR